MANHHGQIWNASEFGRAFGVAHTTVHRYLDLLTETFMVRQLQSWHENIGKRQVRRRRCAPATVAIRALPLGRILQDLPPLR